MILLDVQQLFLIFISIIIHLLVPDNYKHSWVLCSNSSINGNLWASFVVHAAPQLRTLNIKQVSFVYMYELLDRLMIQSQSSGNKIQCLHGLMQTPALTILTRFIFRVRWHLQVFLPQWLLEQDYSEERIVQIAQKNLLWHQLLLQLDFKHYETLAGTLGDVEDQSTAKFCPRRIQSQFENPQSPKFCTSFKLHLTPIGSIITLLLLGFVHLH